MIYLRTYRLNFIFLALSVFICIAINDEPFFWDTIQLGAMHGDWFYQQGFQSFLLPNRIDSGHIPVFGWYLALAWHVFGQNLLVSHLVMAPWIFLVFIGLHKQVGRNYLAKTAKDIKPRRLIIALGISLFLLDPVLISQLTLISPDVILVAAFLLALNSIQEKKSFLLAVAIILLGLISLRGIMVASCLFIWQISNQFYSIKSKPWTKLTKLLLPYLPAAILVVFYLAYHYSIKGWVGVHNNSPWSESFASVGLKGTLKQIAIVLWRFLDFGRIFLWTSLTILIWWFYKKDLFNNQFKNDFKETISFVRLAIILFIVLALPAIISTGLSQHRYFLPFFIVITLIFWQLLLRIQNTVWRNVLWIIAFVGLASGNLWIYPDRMAQGWDASLAHKPYFECKKHLKKFISEENILSSDIGTVFPEVGPSHFRYLNNKKEGFQTLDIEHQAYVFYSNIMNDFTDEQLDDLADNWDVIYHYSNFGVYIRLYHRRAVSKN